MVTLKLQRRLTIIGLNIINSLAVPFANASISLLVIRLHSEELWGAFVSVMLVVQLGAHIASWGNKEYLLREFSRHPDQITHHWQRSLITRLWLGIGLCGLLLFFHFPPPRLLLAVAWGFGLVLVQSFDVLVVYRRTFLLDTIIKVGGIGVMVLAVFLWRRDLTVDALLGFFAAVYLTQTLIYSVIFRRDVLPSHHLLPSMFSICLPYLKQALPFFLLGFSGLLASRIDLYAISTLLDETDVGRYQVFINLMIVIQAISNFIMLPFVKNVYRLPDQTIHKIALRLFILGLLMMIPAVVVIDWLLTTVYHLTYSSEFMILGGLFALPIYAYLPLIYRLYKRDRQQVVLVVNLAAAGGNLTLTLLLLPSWDITGAILASAVVQWGMLLIYLFYSRETADYALPQMPSNT